MSDNAGRVRIERWWKKRYQAWIRSGQKTLPSPDHRRDEPTQITQRGAAKAQRDSPDRKDQLGFGKFMRLV